jgi:hypothetical protein
MMLVNSRETPHLNLGVQLVGLRFAHFNEVCGYGDLHKFDRLVVFD